MNAVTGLFRSFWGALVGLIALLIVLEHAGGFSRVLGGVTNFTTRTVKSFR